MRILMTQRRLTHRGGSEMFTVEVAAELGRRGHQVAVYCPRIGDLAKIMYASGVQAKSRLSEIPWTPDIIHGQHHLQAIAALSHFLNVPAIYYCHGVSAWVEQVPLHERIRKYLMMCEWMVTPVVTEFGIPPDRVAAIPNFVNTERFSHVRNPPARPRRALLYGNSPFPADELFRLEDACRSEGMSLDKIGNAYGNPQPRPEAFLPDYDLVFAIGKSAVEALACGCAVVPIIPGLAGQLVDMNNLDDWTYSNFSPRYYASATRISGQWLSSQLLNYSPETVSQVCAKVRKERTLRGAVDVLERIYDSVVTNYDKSAATMSAEFAPYLEKLSLEVDELWVELDRRIQLDTTAHPLNGWRRYAKRLFRLMTGATPLRAKRSPTSDR